MQIEKFAVFDAPDGGYAVEVAPFKMMYFDVLDYITYCKLAVIAGCKPNQILLIGNLEEKNNDS